MRQNVWPAAFSLLERSAAKFADSSPEDREAAEPGEKSLLWVDTRTIPRMGRRLFQ